MDFYLEALDQEMDKNKILRLAYSWKHLLNTLELNDLNSKFLLTNKDTSPTTRKIYKISNNVTTQYHKSNTTSTISGN